MITIRRALLQAIETLRSEGVDSPRLDSELLMARVLASDRAAVLTWPERQLTPKELTTFRRLVARRAAREPLPYILGHREFFGLDLVVDRRVLIPRPETELLVERALDLAGTRDARLVADVGAGSGAIAVALAVHLPQVTVYALDDSAEALAVTSENARRHAVQDRIHCLVGDLVEPLPQPVDLVTANLPYVASGEWPALPPEVREYEPRAALDGGVDGLDAIRRLLSSVAPYLRARGAVLLEIGATQGEAVSALARTHFPQAAVRLHQDYAGLDRLVVVEI
jgi:release factor glutamine methyltransferase